MLQDYPAILLNELQVLVQQVQETIYERKLVEECSQTSINREVKELKDCLQSREKDLLAVLEIAQEFIEKDITHTTDAEKLRAELDKCHLREALLKEEIEDLKVFPKKHSLITVNEGHFKVCNALIDAEKSLAQLENARQVSDAKSAPLSPQNIIMTDSPAKQNTLQLKLNSLTRKYHAEEVERLKKKLNDSKSCAKNAQSRRVEIEDRLKSAYLTIKDLKLRISELSGQVNHLTCETEVQTARAKNFELHASNLIEKLSGLEE